MSGKIQMHEHEIAGLLERMRRVEPRSRAELDSYIQTFLGLKTPSAAICENHVSPLDYLYFSLLSKPRDNCDIVVWSNRGGGKTQLGAVASLLECVWLKNCQVRILAGSEEQALRMYGYLRAAINFGYEGCVEGKVKSRMCEFDNGSEVQVLTQSQSSVRGHHVQRLRCDEVELFNEDVWRAAQFITQSKNGIAQRMEIFSTMHQPFGLMNRIINDAPKNKMRIFSWCLWEVIEKCRGRCCSQCCLYKDCRGRAKGADGYYSIDDAIAQMRRSSRAAWESEMLCLQPNRENAVFSEFNVGRHVRQVSYNSNYKLYRSIDFGFSNPLACLLIQVDSHDNVLVLDEHIKSRTVLAEHVRLIRERWPWPVEMTYCDPAGRQGNEITGTNAVIELAALGIGTCSRSSRIIDGLNLIRNRLAPADGNVQLFISPKCSCLIRAMQALRYGRTAGGKISELPEKDGVHDHVTDALRYFFVNHFGRSGKIEEVRY